MNEPIVTLVGNLAGDPELRFTASGVAVCKFRMAQTPRTKTAGGTEWKDGEPFWINVSAWRGLGENVAATLASGMRVIVTGRLEQRSYDHKDGYRVTVVELTADAVGPDLSYATATVTKVARNGGEAGGRTTAAPAARPAQSETPPSSDW